MYRQYPFSEQKQWKAKVKVKETDPTCGQIWLFPVTELTSTEFPAPTKEFTHVISVLTEPYEFSIPSVFTDKELSVVRHGLRPMPRAVHPRGTMCSAGWPPLHFAAKPNSCQPAS